MTTLAEARRVVRRARAAEEKATTERTRKRALRLVGRCFVFDNGGGGARWPLYVRVLAVRSVWSDVADLWVERIFQSPDDMYGTAVQRDGRINAYGGKLDPSYKPISEQEYMEKTGAILAGLGLARRDDIEKFIDELMEKRRTEEEGI